MPNMWVSKEVRELCYKQKGTCDENGNPRNIVHHIDFDHYNNDPENLIWVSKSEHSKIHQTGKKFTEEHRRNISLAGMGNTNASGKRSEEICKKFKEERLKRYKDPKERIKCGNAMRGKHHSDETKAKMSAAKKGKCKHNLGRHWHLENGRRVWSD